VSLVSTTLWEQIASDFYTYGQAMKVLGVSKRTMWKWVKAGKLAVHRVGREVLIEKTEVERLKAGR